MKLCGRCQTSKPLTEFHKRGSGRQPWCKDCKRDHDREYYRANHAAVRKIRDRTLAS